MIKVILKRSLVAFIVMAYCKLLLAQNAPTAYTTDDTFCQSVQQLMTGSTLLSDNVIHHDHDTFAESKASTSPLVTHQYVSYLLPGGDRSDIPITVSCKVKTAERINNSLDESGRADSSTRAKTEQSCRFINQHTLSQIVDRSPKDPNVRTDIVFDDDKSVYIGPSWLRPWPYQVAYQAEDGRLHIRAKTLHIEHSMFIPMPSSFMGVHYCHLISPEYLNALSLGELTAPGLL